MTGTSLPSSQVRSFSLSAATPGFCKPMEFSMPDGVSAIRGLAFPCQPFKETPFVVTAPKSEMS